MLLDSMTPSLRGGTGVTWDWKQFAPFVEAVRNSVDVIVAGGLKAENVQEAIRVLHPWGVDVVSGVEREPGKKDHEKVRAFVAAVREAESLRG
jgi:phosphoribosylanthranilate isomerase